MRATNANERFPSTTSRLNYLSCSHHPPKSPRLSSRPAGGVHARRELVTSRAERELRRSAPVVGVGFGTRFLGSHAATGGGSFPGCRCIFSVEVHSTNVLNVNDVGIRVYPDQEIVFTELLCFMQARNEEVFALIKTSS